MNLLHRLAGIAARIVHDVADAPRVARELKKIRTERGPVPVPLTADDVKGEIPTPEQVEEAAREYERARTDGNAAERIKRAAKKVLDRAPDGSYGLVTVERFESARQVPDLDRIKEVFQQLGREVPMKRCQPSVSLTWIEEAAHPETETFAVAA